MSTAWRCKEYCSANRRSWLRRWPMSSNREDRSSGESVSSTVRTLPPGGPSERRRSMRSSPFSTRLTVTSSLLWCSSCSFMASALFDHAAHGLKQSGEATKFGVEFAADVFRELSVASEAGGIDFLQMSPICRKQCCDRPAPRLRRWVERYLGDEVPDFAAELLHQLAQPGLLLCCEIVFDPAQDSRLFVEPFENGLAHLLDFPEEHGHNPAVVFAQTQLVAGVRHLGAISRPARCTERAL